MPEPRMSFHDFLRATEAHLAAWLEDFQDYAEDYLNETEKEERQRELQKVTELCQAAGHWVEHFGPTTTHLPFRLTAWIHYSRHQMEVAEIRTLCGLPVPPAQITDDLFLERGEVSCDNCIAIYATAVDPAEESERIQIRVLVCGGRIYDDYVHLCGVLDALASQCRIVQIIEGEARGADRLARRYAEERGIPVLPFPAQWELYGPSAGFKRNAAMLEHGKPDLVVAFPGGKGTADMVAKARDAGVPILSL